MSALPIEPLSAVIGAVFALILAPVGYFLAKLLRNVLKEWGRELLEGGLYYASRAFTHTVAAHLALRRYCRLRLADDRWLHIPAKVDVSVDIDSIRPAGS